MSIDRNNLNANINFKFSDKYYEKYHNRMVEIATYLFRDHYASILNIFSPD